MEHFREKSSFLKLIETYQGDTSVSVQELYDKFKAELEEDKKTKEEGYNKIIADFSNSYIKLFTKDGMFGRSELEVFKIDSLEIGGFTDRGERVFKAVGVKISIGICGVTIRDFDNYVDSIFTESQLKQFSKISKLEFDYFLEEGHSINEKINKLLNK